MALPKAAVPRKCDLCGIDINPLVSRYLFLNVGWRGRGTPKPHDTHDTVFCGPCAEAVLDALSPYALPALVRSMAKMRR